MSGMDSKVEIALRGNEFKRVLEKYFDAVKKKYELKKVDIEVLLYLSDCGEKDTPTDIYMTLGLNRGHVSQAIDSLMKKGYVQAVADANDRRIAHYIIIESAQEIISKVALLKKEFDEKIFDGLSPEEIIEYKRITFKIMQNMQKMEKM